MMSRKHYVAVAGILNDAWRKFPDDACALHAVTVDLARVFRGDNGNFDRQRFFDAVTDGTSAGRIDPGMTTQCDCSEEYGPCEMHCQLVAQREGKPIVEQRAMTLSDIMEFDHVVEVHADGSVTDGPAGGVLPMPAIVTAPCPYSGELRRNKLGNVAGRGIATIHQLAEIGAEFGLSLRALTRPGVGRHARSLPGDA